ncbi:MAG TPA: dTDP-4-dehydrorhamnose 3,5-epimerase [Melioribacteraceae bacterium]|nr:dTDP-4-dehydrorhamnose 3,5-epimerase [Melioribacteraceae bacterium]
MEIIETIIKEVKIIKPNVYKDERGYFFESFNKNRFHLNGIDIEFVQDNISKSQKGTIRGLHYQVGEFAQDKLCQVIFGKVLDVAIDIRFGSPTFGKYVAIELSDENNLQLLIPKGFAHGFEVLSDYAIFHYKCSNFYNKDCERSILFNDKDINIKWTTPNPIISDKDKNSINFKNINKDFLI